ncbi:alkanesulfonate monooxygenase [Candidimonas nitroreducens]|uniref:Alkanesulfonate monooxygenase n=2 Tax=Candidimonas nitroreducens TaxID=683354 RepID=A0A225MJY7_9BURK|nr:alkanesulfonate monooxygenase [Candidimonas nitroreducens]
MPAKLIGMIGVEPPSTSALHIIAGGNISPDYVTEFSRAHEDAGFDSVLVGYNTASAEGFNVAAYAAAHTKNLAFLIAHRPGVVAPTFAARAAATFDHFSGGRIALHIISGLSDAEMAAEGDFSTKELRYHRAAEYLDIMRKIWTSSERFDYDGEFYKLKGAYSAVKPLQNPHVPLFFGGSSTGALEMGAKHCDVYAVYGEPLKETSDVIADFRKRAAEFGRTPKFNISFRPVIADTEDEAWEKALKIQNDLIAQNLPKEARDRSAQRMLDAASRSDIHDERLWMGAARVSGARGNSSCLVGTPRQVAEAMLKYYRLGIESFLIRGFDPVNDTKEFGKELIPLLKEGALQVDREKSSEKVEA